MLTSARRISSVLLAGATAGALLLATGAPAVAAAKPATYPNVSLDKALSLMPVAKALPVHMVSSGKAEMPGDGFAIPCFEAGTDPLIPIKASGEVTAVYKAAHFSLTSAQPLSWVVTATIFHNSAKAAAAAKIVLHAEKTCPKKSGDGSEDNPSITRTLGQAYAVGAWKGYRSVDHFSGDTAAGEPAAGGRYIDVYLTRGNVMLHIEEIAPAVAAAVRVRTPGARR